MTRLPLIVSGAAFALTLALTAFVPPSDDAPGPLAERESPLPTMTMAAMTVSTTGSF